MAGAKLWSFPFLRFGTVRAALLSSPRPSDSYCRPPIRNPRMHVRPVSSPPSPSLSTSTHVRRMHYSGIDWENWRPTGCTDVAGNQAHRFPHRAVGSLQSQLFPIWLFRASHRQASTNNQPTKADQRSSFYYRHPRGRTYTRELRILDRMKTSRIIVMHDNIMI